MEVIGKSSLWVEKYRPKTVKDLILPAPIKTFLAKIVESKEVPNLLFFSSAGRGKTSTAFAITNDLDADVLYINASIENSIDTVRFKVQQFAMTSSFSDGKKVVILDEMDRMLNAQDALKALIEQCEANCRFIITTNNLSKIIDPIKSRTQLIDFNFSSKETKELVIAYFKRVCWILEQEKIVFDKATLAEFVKKAYPDFRKTLSELQKFVQMHGSVDEKIFSSLDDSTFNSLVEELRNRKFNAVRKLATEIDPDTFYGQLYSEMDKLLEDKCKPDAIVALADSAYRSSLTVNKELELASCLVGLMRICIWK
jgi:DNA polymerase III delta prime subunit